jgi:murein L,D-transpeptidase YafK
MRSANRAVSKVRLSSRGVVVLRRYRIRIVNLFQLAVVLFITLHLPPAVAAPEHADRILVLKSQHVLALFNHGKQIKTYKVALGGNPVGAKDRQGDHKTPEGHYIIDAKNERSQFHLALHISYPNAKDQARAATAGVSSGGDIMIHGLPPNFAWVGPLHRQTDWTDGCIAVTNAEIEEIWNLVPVGTPVDIQP